MKFKVLNEDSREGTEKTPRAPQRRGFLKKAGTIVVAAPVIDSLSKDGLLVRAAHAQTAPSLIESDFGGPIGEAIT